ncbi:MAG: hypothetical protein JWO10_2210, partial [Microbacteriaceae bacterium]|nr:hypothetical protein [Microbacteriaceae bacterium]
AVVTGLASVLLSVVASALLQGIISMEVARATLGEKSTLRQLWRRARGRFGALIGWTLLLLLASAIVLAILVGIIVLLVTTLGVGGVIAGVLVGIFGFLGLLVLYAWIGTKVAFVPSVLMLERLPLRLAVARSWSLTRGYFWKVFGIQLLVSAIIGVVTQVVSIPLSFGAPLLVTLLNPNGQVTATTAIIPIAFAVLSVVISIVFGAITSVVSSATSALLYLDVRIRKEGLDLELIRFVEARQAGDASVADPYLVAETTPGE